MIRWGIIGSGDWFERYHIPVLNKLVQNNEITLAGVWNRTVEKAEVLARRHSIAHVYKTVDQLLSDTSLDCLSIVLNKSIADDYIKKAAQKGLPFITEKPPAGTYAAAKELLSIVGSLPHIVGFNRRYMQLIKHAKDYITPSLHGYEFNMWRSNRIDTRYVFETGIHALNLVEYLFGPAIQVQIITKFPIAKTAPALLLKLTHATCTGYINFQTQGKDSREHLRIFCSERLIELFIKQPLASDHNELLRVFTQGSWKILSENSTFADECDAFGFTSEYREMIDILSGKGKSQSTMQTSLACMRIAEWTESASAGDILTL